MWSGQPCKTEKSKSNVQDQKKQREVIEISMNNETPRKVPKKDVRSGRAYYDQWDKYVAEAEKVCMISGLMIIFDWAYGYVMVPKFLT